MSTATPGRVGILLLAAGRSRRFGSDKRVARVAFSGLTLLETTLREAQSSGLPIRVFLRREDEAIAVRLKHEAALTLFVSRRADEGMGATLADAVAGINCWDAAIVALADMPWVQASTYLALAQSCLRETIAVPHYRGRRGNPVCFGARWYSALMQCGGDSGARDLLAANPKAICRVDVDDAGILTDVDRPTDLQAMR